ncbi:hypothetical protein POREN0001_1186 [Porphyromonas endodontalis ATCC 35406]|uniref:Uncharacterized protein n=1 Tax=Porphyromonas endodontalis (strain ATCC 35406 / DSM 24491 / JCM 8526 / CCUG 16442 / BCRC 14492 / NCTC 13058 / HG 370) TaxID=553175 RepID=C3J7U4_POREA|nr:hypothetical protein POREN0001_1186 [Porphyromonas endodontalis ATCC 35406]
MQKSRVSHYLCSKDRYYYLGTRSSLRGQIYNVSAQHNTVCADF